MYSIDLSKMPTAAAIKAEMRLDEKKAFLEGALTGTGREGIDKIVRFLDDTDFYRAPGAAVYQSNYAGGLLDHSLITFATAARVCGAMKEVMPSISGRLPDESVAIASLLHGVCKVGYYRAEEKRRRRTDGEWESYDYYVADDNFPIGHSEKSVIMLVTLGLKLTPDEMIAIRYSTGMWDGGMFTAEMRASYEKASNICPLMHAIQTGVYMSSKLFEDRV